MPNLSIHPALPYLSSFFGTIFLGFGVTYILYPQTGYSLYGFSSSPTTPADWAVMERVMILYGAKDLFLGAAILASTWYGTRKSAGLILMAANVGLASHHVASSLALPTTTVTFLSTVDTAKIPLYLATGPSLDVWTTSEDTEAWFESILLGKPAASQITAGNATAHEWWHLARSQSPIGILVQIQAVKEETQKPRITEILFYGTIADPTTGGLPTPPSSSPHLHNAPVENLPELRVHALPLSSDRLYDQDAGPLENDGAQFLPPLHDTQSTPESPKRKRDIFEEATLANKKARGKGGQGVAAAAARASESQQQPYGHRKSLSIDTKSSPFPDLRPPSANSALSRTNSRQLSRSPSISSDNRPLSRKGVAEGCGKRSTLSQVATVPLPPEEPTTESRNKEALSRVVMAAMRMHGMQQRKKTRSRRASVAPGVEESRQLSDGAAAEEVAKDDEFKLIYHQTYKGAALALRKHMADKPLHAQPARLRDVVEKLLTIFLSDPLAEALPSEESTNPLATPGSKQKLGGPGSIHGHASPFDLPSITRPSMTRSVTDSHVHTGSPVSRRQVDAT
ncbi:Nn.00g076320.m01.CDS01 [Neocucurbitaria sp. VM-36]